MPGIKKGMPTKHTNDTNEKPEGEFSLAISGARFQFGNTPPSQS